MAAAEGSELFGGKFPHLPPPPALLGSYLPELSPLRMFCASAHIHHQTGGGFGKHAKHPKNFDLFAYVFLDA